jgi:L-asparaginase II
MAELAVVERSGFVESRHCGTLVGLAADGSVAVSLGAVSATILPRSSTKPWQAAGCRAAGLTLSTAATALSAGSHTGEDRHVALSGRSWPTPDCPKRTCAALRTGRRTRRRGTG